MRSNGHVGIRMDEEDESRCGQGATGYLICVLEINLQPLLLEAIEGWL